MMPENRSHNSVKKLILFLEKPEAGQGIKE